MFEEEFQALFQDMFSPSEMTDDDTKEISNIRDASLITLFLS